MNKPAHFSSLRRRLPFVEQSNLFSHKTSEDEQDEGSGIGGPSTGTVTSKTDNNSQPHDSQSAVIGVNKHKHKHHHKHQTEPTETETTSVFDGFEVTQLTKPPGSFNGFGITQETSPPGFFDGFEVDSSVPTGTTNNENTNHNEYPNQGTFSNLADIPNTPVPYKQIFLCVGLSLACVILGLCYWRNSFVIHKRTKTKRQMAKLNKKQQKEQQRAEQRKQAKMNHLKKLYEDFEKHKAQLSVDPIQGDNVLSPTYSPKRLVAIHMGENANHKIEKIDFIEDIEFGQELSQSHSEDDSPALTMRMVRRNSSTEEHWIQYSSYSSDETTTESDTSNGEEELKSIQ